MHVCVRVGRLGPVARFVPLATRYVYVRIRIIQIVSECACSSYAYNAARNRTCNLYPSCTHTQTINFTLKFTLGSNVQTAISHTDGNIMLMAYSIRILKQVKNETYIRWRWICDGIRKTERLMDSTLSCVYVCVRMVFRNYAKWCCAFKHKLDISSYSSKPYHMLTIK